MPDRRNIRHYRPIVLGPDQEDSQDLLATIQAVAIKSSWLSQEQFDQGEIRFELLCPIPLSDCIDSS